MFLLGISLMGDALRSGSNEKIKTVMASMTDRPVKGFLLGAGTTMLIQSSSALSIICVNFAEAGVLSIEQAVPVIMGSVFGTSITGWVICLSGISSSESIFGLIFSSSTLNCLFALAGIALRMFTKKEGGKRAGNILLGLAVLMIGMEMMSEAVIPLRESEVFLKLLTGFKNPLIGILVGTIFTCLIQSASAAVGVLQALTATGVLEFYMAFPLIIGISIGAAMPILLSSTGMSIKGKETAKSYLFINLSGAIIVGCLFYLLNAICPFSLMNVTMTTVSVALVNSVYRLISVLVTFTLYQINGFVYKYCPESRNK